MDLNQLRIDINHLYAQEHAALGLRGARHMLDAARQWDLAPVLRNRGALVFPHAGVQDCAKQISAVINACLDSGADTVMVISVLHAFTDDMEQARRRVAAGGNPAIERIWGIQGPDFDRGNEWAFDHALFTFR
jgi:glycine/D-amino acid oxidase-like deaminating enzyme